MLKVITTDGIVSPQQYDILIRPVDKNDYSIHVSTIRGWVKIFDSTTLNKNSVDTSTLDEIKALNKTVKTLQNDFKSALKRISSLEKVMSETKDVEPTK